MVARREGGCLCEKEHPPKSQVGAEKLVRQTCEHLQSEVLAKHHLTSILAHHLN